MTAAAAVAAAASFASCVCWSSRFDSALFFTWQLRRPSLSFPCRLRLVLRQSMASSLTTKATLGLTKPAAVEFPQISFSAKEIDISEWNGDVLAVAISEKDMSKGSDSKFENPILKKLDEQLGGLLADVSEEEDFKGKAGQAAVIRLPGLGFKRLSLVGLGPIAPSSMTTSYRGIGEAVASTARAAQASNAAIVVASLISKDARVLAASAIASGTILGIYEDNRFKSETKKALLKSVDIIGLGAGPELEKKLRYASDISSGVIFGKELVNAPANVLTPGALAEEVSKIASSYSDVFTAKIFDAEQCKEMNMGSYLAVAAASSNPPHFIHLCYRPIDGNIKTKLAIVGKGLTFDSGGYNIKTGPGSSIELMKFDMGGSAAAFGAAKAIGQIKPPGVEVHFIVAACENMISGTGMRPGDIITASNGKTIEVNNTDAEGRLTLADALVYACNQGIEKVVDLATLTGACIVALGPSIAGFFTPSDELAKEIIAASEVAGEKLWRMPLEDSYWESMKSSVADMLNTGGRPGGAITAALFLKQFVDEKVQWMHIDMAGPVWNEKKRTSTGFGVSTLVEWVLLNSS
ncbi:Leucine aminopeptidase 2, chloroplastic [Apostasia shenzhenica]|uniref:Leucine aminopeptidase 2, chloroplastic n=1 Tax=Apostasia shenzhenica TaxID=1088818 RepID=A0A2I0A5M2_9ASPA|nr:Leucine aminopeptidase 2, chloroplastic [Apostasia shenzhenica]